MSAKQQVFRHLNQLWGLDIPLNSKIQTSRSRRLLEAGCFCWWVSEEGNYYNRWLGSTMTLKALAESIKTKPQYPLLIHCDGDLEIMPSDDADFWIANDDCIFNPNKVNYYWQDGLLHFET